MSPNYPNASPPGLNCSWTIVGPEDADLLLWFEYFSLDVNDYLNVIWYIYFVNNLHFYLQKSLDVVNLRFVAFKMLQTNFDSEGY